jgi:hypothetical protein
LAILHATNLNARSHLTKTKILRKIKHELLERQYLPEVVTSILETAKEMNIGFVGGRLTYTAINVDESNTGEISDEEYESDSGMTDDFYFALFHCEQSGDDNVNVETIDATSMPSCSDSYVDGPIKNN